MKYKVDSIGRRVPAENCPKCNYNNWHGPKYVWFVGKLRYACGGCGYATYRKGVNEEA